MEDLAKREGLAEKLAEADKELEKLPKIPHIHFVDCLNEKTDNFEPIVFAKRLLAESHLKTVRTSGVIYVYDEQKGIYLPFGEQFIQEAMAICLDEENRHRHLADILHHIKGMTYFDPVEPDPERIVLENGILNFNTMKLEPFNSNEFFIIHVPVAYNSAAQCPTILKFLNEVFIEKQINIVQEFIGYCLYRKYLFHAAIMLIGKGKNGKSTFLELLTTFLGRDNVSHETLQSLCNDRFAKSELYGKLANTSNEIPSSILKETGPFRTLTGNDSVSAQKKFHNPFTFLNFAKLLFACNKIPETLDDTDAFFRRWIIIVCDNLFYGEKCDPKILSKITAPDELSGLLNWALEGLKRLIESGKFSENEDVEEKRKDYTRKSNSAKAFIEESLQYSPYHNDFIPQSELYQKYILFCQANNLPSSKKAVLTQNINQYLPQSKQTTARVEAKEGVHVWQYMKFVATVATFLSKGNNLENYSKEVYRVATPATNSDSSPSENQKPIILREGVVCGQCLHNGKASCDPPIRDMDFHLIMATAKYAESCRAFIPKGSEKNA